MSTAWASAWLGGSPWFAFLALALAAAVGWSVLEGRRRGISRVLVIDIGIAALVGGLVGGRIHHVLFEPLPADPLGPEEREELRTALAASGPAASYSWAHTLGEPERALARTWLAQGRAPAALGFAADMPPGRWRQAAFERLREDPADVPARWWYAARPGELLQVWKGGFGFLGGLFLSTLLSMGVVRRHGESIPRVADLAAPAVALGLAVGRLGCFTSGCCYGSECPPGPWVVAPPWWEGPPYDVPRWPTALLECAWALGCFALLRIASRRGPPGQAFLLLLVLYAPGRFLLEALRGDPRGGALGLSTSQWLVLAAGVPALVVWAIRSHRARRAPG